jgi:valine--pyruvate aminotransferase
MLSIVARSVGLVGEKVRPTPQIRNTENNIMKLTKFGDKFTGTLGIQELMDDLGKAMASSDGNQIMLGGGNPGHLTEVQALFRQSMETIMKQPHAFERIVGNYDTPAGEAGFIQALAELLRDRFNWPISAENIMLTNGSQSAFFFLFNMLAGQCADGKFRKVLLPVVPEYIGYEDVGIDSNIFATRKPTIELLENREFKYRVDFDNLNITDEISALCISRPGNPTGNVITDDEVAKLSALAQKHEIPLIIDGAYGSPFPNIIYTDAKPHWDDHIILTLSLSKLGLPGLRTGIVIANPEIIRTLAVMNSVFTLSPGSMGVAIAHEMVKNGDIIRVSDELIQSHYRAKMERGLQNLHKSLAGIDYYIHRPEGAMFFWIWFKDLPITSAELYNRLKDRGVLCVSGHYFFPGIEEDWAHKNECIRLTYSQNPEDVEKGIAIIAEEVRQVYSL